MKKLCILLLIPIVLWSCSNGQESGGENIVYPVTKKVDTIDYYFETEVPDPYRWLEDDNSDETGDWVKRQNEVTFGYLGEIPKHCNGQ